MSEKDIFCKILNGEAGAEFLFETNDLAVFPDINPSAPVHYLIVPKKHIETVSNAKEEDKELLGEMILAGERAARELGVENSHKLVFNVGKKGGQEVYHIHLHLLGYK